MCNLFKPWYLTVELHRYRYKPRQTSTGNINRNTEVMELFVNLLVPIAGISTMGILYLESKELFWITEQKVNSSYLLHNFSHIVTILNYYILYWYFSHI